MDGLRKYLQTNFKKQAAFKQYLRTKSDNDFHNYQIQRNKVKQVILEDKMDHESLIISDLKSNPKRLHKYKDKSKRLNILLAH